MNKYSSTVCWQINRNWQYRSRKQVNVRWSVKCYCTVKTGGTIKHKQREKNYGKSTRSYSNELTIFSPYKQKGRKTSVDKTEVKQSRKMIKTKAKTNDNKDNNNHNNNRVAQVYARTARCRGKQFKRLEMGWKYFDCDSSCVVCGVRAEGWIKCCNTHKAQWFAKAIRWHQKHN